MTEKNTDAPLPEKRPDNEMLVRQVSLFPNLRSIEDEKAEKVEIRFRNTVLKALFPDTEFLLVSSGDPSDFDIESRDEILNLLTESIDGKQIDFATGSRKHGVVWFSNEEIAKHFFASPEETVAYGSNLVTECVGVKNVDLKVLVVEDKERMTGDCHAKASPRLWELFGADPLRVAQFRIGVLDAGPQGQAILAKGVAMAADLDGEAYDLIIPRSSFKSSFKPECGEYTWNSAVMGVQGFSQERSTRVSYTITEWFSSAALYKDVAPEAIRRARILQVATHDPLAAKAYFLNNFDVQELDPDEMNLGDDSLQVSDQRKELNRAFEVLRADTSNKFLFHPYIQDSFARFTRTEWINLTTGGGMRWPSAQAVPDESLKHLEVCIPEKPEGTYIMTRYPVRTKYDIQIVTNKHIAGYEHYKGIIVMNHDTAAEFGGDFDGDYFTFVSTILYPNLAKEVAEWNQNRTPEVEKHKTKKRSDYTPENLSGIVVDNLSNPVGLITYHIASAAAKGRDDIVDQLKQQLQYAVDGFKHNVQPDMELVEELTKGLYAPGWLGGKFEKETYSKWGGLKDPQTFIDYPIQSYGPGAIAFLAKNVTPHFEPSRMRARPLQQFDHLVPPAPPEYAAAAQFLKKQYGQLVGKAMSSGDDKKAKSRAFETFNRLLDEAIEGFTNGKIDEFLIENKRAPETHEIEQITKQVRLDLAAAMWHSAHNEHAERTAKDRNGLPIPSRKPSSGSFGFQLKDEILELTQQREHEVKIEKVLIIGIQHYDCNNRQFHGESHDIVVKNVKHKDRERSEIYLLESGSERKLGLLLPDQRLDDGQYRISLTHQGKSVVGVLDTTKERSNFFLPPRNDEKWPVVREKLIERGVSEKHVDGLYRIGKLWATTTQVVGKNGEAFELTNVAVPTFSPASRQPSGILMYTVSYTDRETGITKDVPNLKLFVKEPTGPEGHGFILHSSALKGPAGEVLAPKNIYLVSKLEEQISLAELRKAEKASFVLLPDPALHPDAPPVHPEIVKWALSSGAKITIGSATEFQKIEAYLRETQPQLKVGRAIPSQPYQTWVEMRKAQQQLVPASPTPAQAPAPVPVQPQIQPKAITPVPTEPKPKPTVEIFTDGSSLGNPGPGGYGVILKSGVHERELSQGYEKTTNNRMELLGAIEGLKALKQPASVTLYTDSKYVTEAIQGRLQKWHENGWKLANRSAVKNVDLWKELVPLLQKHEVRVEWVKGHNGHEMNERCDKLARKAAAGQQLQIDSGFEVGIQTPNLIQQTDKKAAIGVSR